MNQYLNLNAKKSAPSTTDPAPSPSSTAAPAPAAPSPTPEKKRKKPRLPARRLVRHVLRARLVATQSLFSLLTELEREDGRVAASPHLALSYGADGGRSAKEVIGFLRGKGARWEMVRERGDEFGVLSSGEETEGVATEAEGEVR